MVFGDAHAARRHAADPRLARLRRILRAGDIGFGEAWGAGWIDSPDLVALLRLALRNEGRSNRRCSAACWHAAGTACATGCAQHAQRQPPQHPQPLRYRQRFLSPVAGPQLDLFGAIFDGDYGLPLEQAQAAQVPASSTRWVCAPATACWRSAAAGAVLPSTRRARASMCMA
jgi:cyclopropane-fatty-acyl-phospholipid synthase